MNGIILIFHNQIKAKSIQIVRHPFHPLPTNPSPMPQITVRAIDYLRNRKLASNCKLKELDFCSNTIIAEGWAAFSKLPCDTSGINNTFFIKPFTS